MVLRAVASARVRAPRRERSAKIRMDQAKRRDRPPVSQHAPQCAVAAILTRTQSVAVLDPALPAREDALPCADHIVDSDVGSQHVPAPAVVVSGDHDDRRPRFPEIGECGENPEGGAWDDRAPLEPELEQIAVHDERGRATLQASQESERFPLDVVIRKSQVQIGNHIGGRCEHALILADARLLYKGRRAGQSSQLIAMSVDSPQSFRTATRDIEFRVRYAETDQMGVVYHANYLIWCEMGRTDFIRQLGMSYAEMERAGISLAVSDLSARFHAPARYEDLIRVRTTLVALRSRMIEFEYLVSNAETGQRLASARTSLISIDPSGRPIALPDHVRRLFYRNGPHA